MLLLYHVKWNALLAVTQQHHKGQNSMKKKQKSVSAYCWVVYSSSKSWYKSYLYQFNLKSMFTMCNAALEACWNIATADRATPLNWAVRREQAGRHPLPNRTEFINFPKFNKRRLQLLFAHAFSNWLAVSCFSLWKVLLNVHLCQ